MPAVKVALRVAKSVPADMINADLKKRAQAGVRAVIKKHCSSGVIFVKESKEVEITFQIRQKNGVLVLHHDRGIPL